MKTRNIFYLALGFLALSCAKEIAPETSAPEQTYQYVSKNFTAGINPVVDAESVPSRVTLVNGYQIDWGKDDAVAIFDNVSSARNLYKASESGAVTTLTGSVTAGSTEFLALYPDRGETNGAPRLSREGNVIKDCYVAQTQRPVPGAIYPNCAYMIAKADAVDALEFINLTSIVKFNLAAELTDVKSMTLIGNNNEAISGTFNVDWNNGDPAIIVTNPDTYVTIAKSNGESLATGDYYFVILPVEFKNGFTVILSKQDGTQIAKTTQKALPSLEGGNKILPMKPVAASDYASHMNYFIRYNDGFDITFGGYTFNKSTHGNATLLNGTKKTKEIRAVTGVYFVDPGCTDISLGGGNGRQKLIVAGSDASRRSDITITTSQQVAVDSDATTKNECFVLANLDCKIPTSGNVFNIVRLNVAQYGAIVINNCALNGIRTGLMNMDASSSSVPEVALDLDLLEISDSEIGIDYTGQAWMIMQRGSVSTCAKFSVTNSVFYVVGGPEKGVTQFLLMHANNSGKGFQFGEVICNNNTFVDTPVTGSAISALSAGSHTSNGNLFVNPLYKNTNKNNGSIAGYATKPSNGECINNYYYSTALNTENALYKLNAPGYADDFTGRKGSPVLLSANPLSTLWDPANGAYGAYDFAVASGTAPAYNKIGAQRADMTPVTAALNSPALNYSEVNLGTF